ncbi:MAG: ABC transporter ATP-binding protein [Phycisphaerales bacterium]
MISVRQVVKSFGRVRAVSGVSFEVPSGQVVGLLGANGAGKTTTLRMITGFLPPDQGRISVAGHDTLDESLEARRSLGYLPESAPAYGEMGVEDFLDFRGRLYGMTRGPRRHAVESAMERCDLIGVRRRRVGHLSKGFRQRVGLAAAILHAPKVLILDEPTNGLDPRQIGHARDLIRDLARNCTVVVSSHILPEVEQTCDRLIIMARGVVRVDAKPRELLDALREVSPYIVDVKTPTPADAAAVGAFLSGVHGVASARPATEAATEAGWSAWRVTARADAPDLRESIASAAAARGVLIRELRREAPTLERIFLRFIDAEDEFRMPGTRPATPPPTPATTLIPPEPVAARR